MNRKQILLLAAGVAMALAMTPPARASDGAGTHLVADLTLGVEIPPVSYLGPGFSYGGIIGIGGKFRDFPPRFYFIAGASAAGFEGDGTHPGAGVSFGAERTYVDIFGGLRVLMPIWDEIRIYADILGGACWVDGTVLRSDGSSLGKDDWAAEWSVALGLEYRWHENAATGIRVEGLFGGNDVEILDEYAGQDEGSWARVNLMVTQAWML